jgi:hypothetical protein
MIQRKFTCDGCGKIWLSAPSTGPHRGDQTPDGWWMVQGWTLGGDPRQEFRIGPDRETETSEACSKECAATVLRAFAKRIEQSSVLPPPDPERSTGTRARPRPGRGVERAP